MTIEYKTGKTTSVSDALYEVIEGAASAMTALAHGHLEEWELRRLEAYVAQAIGHLLVGEFLDPEDDGEVGN